MMQRFSDFYVNEKTLNIADGEVKTDEDEVCMDVGQRLADRFGLKLNGWWETTYTFTIPEDVPNARNTFLAKNEEEVIKKLERFPEYLEYIMQKKFPDGYEPDPSIPLEPPIECEPLDLASIGKK